MNASPATTGDFGEFIVAELTKCGISFPKTIEAFPLPATWQISTIELDQARTGLAVAVQSCSLDKVAGFLFKLLWPLRVHRPFSKDDDSRFWFNIGGNEGSFRRSEGRLTVLFITCEVSLTIAESHQGLDVGISQHSSDSGYPAQTV